MTHTDPHQRLTTIRHLHILAERYDKPVVEFGDYYAVVIGHDGEPVAFVAPKSGATVADLAAVGVA